MALPAARVRIFHSLFILFLISTNPAFAQTADDPYVASELILSFAPDAELQQRQDILDDLGATSVARFNRIDAGLYRLESMTVVEALQLLDGNPYLVLAEPNYILYEHAIPDDPRFDELWGMRNTGQTGGTPGADISAAQAWNIFTGTQEVVVGVIDTGLDMSHPDIADNVFINEGEIAGNGIDDDGNGFIDDVNGWDFANNDNNPFDDRGHGTHVSGTIGGVGNNGVGVAGVNWSVRILPIKFLGSDGSGTTAAAVQAVEYATLMGVDLTNNSWGGGGFSTALLNAIEDADAAGIHFVASAGNWGQNNDFSPSYPGSYDTPNIISVAATDHNDRMADFSNYGAVSVDLGAPGVNILSSVPGSGYSSYSGTSMAAPHVAGVVAMMVGRFPATPHGLIKERLLTTADPIPALAGLTVSGARLNAFMAIADPDETPPAPVDDLVVVESGSNWLRVAWSATGDDGSVGTAVSYEMRRAGFPLDDSNFASGILVEGLSPPLLSGTPEEHVVDGLDFLTTYWFALVARDEFGNPSLVSNSASGSTLGIPTASVSPTSLSEALLTGATSSQSLSLSNTGEGTLDFVFGPVEYLATPATSAVATEPGQPNEAYIAQYDVAPLLAGPQEVDRSLTPEGFMGRSPSRLVSEYLEYLQSSVEGAVIYYDDMESGAPGWSHAPTSGSVDRWGLVTTRSASGTNSWNVAQHSGSGSDALYSPLIDLPGLPELRLAFEHWYNFDDCGGDQTFEPDGGIVEVSTDEGSTWTQIVPLAGYPYVLDDICSNPLAFLEAYSHDGGEDAGFIPAVFDLSEFAGNSIVLRFHAGWDCGNCELNEGWYIDDVTVFAGIPPWLGVDLVSGSLSAGESTDVGVAFNAAGLFGGLHTANLVVGSNDPVTPELLVPVDLRVTGAPDIAVTPTSLDFGIVFVDGSAQRTLRIENIGTDVLDITSIIAGDPTLSTSVASVVLAAGESRVVEVTYAPSAAVELDTQITLVSNDPDEGTIAIGVAGNGVEPPIIALSPASVEVDLYTGETANRIVTVRNDGAADLELEVATAAAETSAAADLSPGALERFGSAFSAVASTVDDPFAAGTEPSFPDPDPKRDVNHLTASTSDGTGVSILLIHAGDVSEIQSLLLAFPDVEVVDALDGGSSTPTLEDLLAYDAVILAPNSQFANKAVLGDNLADYVDSGGGVIETTPAFVDGRSPEGRWLAEAYSPYELGFGPIGPSSLSDFDASHPLMAGVTSASVDLAATATLRAEAIWVADLSSGEGFVATNERRVVAVNVFLGNSGYWSGDVPLILRNAVVFAGGGPSWLSVDPTVALIPAGESVDLDLRFDAAGLNGGVYSAVLEMTSNDPVRPQRDFPVMLNVTGAPDIEVDPLALDFGELFVGAAATSEFAVENVGTDVLTVSSISSSEADIGIVPSSLVLAVGESAMLHVDWNPTSAGPLAATITLTSDDPDEPGVVVALSGLALDPPDIAVNPGSLGSDLYIGETEQQTLTISNEGVADLVFSLGAFAVEGSSPGSPGSLPMTSQRTVALSAEDSATLNGEPGLGTGLERVYGTDPTILVYTDNILRAPGDNVVERALHRLGLAYTVEYSSPSNFNRLLVEGSWDLVIIDGSRRLMFFPDVEAYVLAGGALIVSYWDIDGSAGGPTSIWETLGLDHAAETFDALPLYRWDRTHPLFSRPNAVPDFTQMRDTVNDNGDKFDAMGTAEAIAGFTPARLPGQGGVLVSGDHPAIVHGFLPGENAEDLDGDSILDAVELYENEIQYLLGGANWLSLDPVAGTISGGQSLDVRVTFDATDLLGGSYGANIVVSSNDPDEAEVTIPTMLTATGIPRIAVDPVSLDFGWLYLTQDRTLELTVSNPGTETLEVASITSPDPEFSADIPGFDVEPNSSQVVHVTFAAVTPGTHDAALSIVHNAEGSPTEVPMTGVGIVPPEIALDPSAIEAAAVAGGQKTKVVTICNEGGSELEFSIGESQDATEVVLYDTIEFAKQADEEGSVETVDPRPAILGSGGPDRFGYTWADSHQPGGPVFDWVDISGVGTPVPFASYTDDGNVGPIPIGFNFPFYGEIFSEINACSNGWLSFTNGATTTYSNQPLPNRGSAVPENMLAALWDDMVYDERFGNSAYYHYDGSKFIVQFELRHIAVFTPPFYEFQVILYPGGRIVYQYNSRGMPVETCTIGIQNGTKDDGLTVAFSDQSYLHDGLAIEFSSGPDWLSAEPSSGVIPPGECLDVAVTLNADELDAADYTGDLTIVSNDITDPRVDIPLLFHVGTVEALVTDAEPNTLNVTSNGMHMAVYVELPEGYDPTEVLLETVKLNGVVPAEPRPFSDNGDFNENGIPDLMFKFDRTACAALLSVGESVEVTISGEVEDTTWFVATDRIRVINPRMTAPNGGEYAVAGGNFPITWENPAEWNVTHADLFWTPDDGESWLEIARDVPGSSCDWTVSADLLTEDARVRVFIYDEEGLLGFDTSDEPFHIVTQITGVAPNVRPIAYALGQNVPNPFNPRTTISFELPRGENVRIGIYDVKGRLVKNLVSEPMTWGRHEVVWDGDDNHGRRVATGVYYYRIVAGDFTATRNMVLVK
jgi:subtilisin family serine protease